MDRGENVLGRWIWAAAGALMMLVGCAESTPSEIGHWEGPQTPALVTVSDLANPGDTKVKLVRTQHYKIYSTIVDRPDLLQRAGQLMEGAFVAYQQLAPDVTLTTYPMDCYLFATRAQWQEFTVQKTGGDATVYLQISRGGYTIHDWYVAYYIGDISTYSVAAHEGWHQFVNRHFKSRLPPFLEEGLACMFEDIQWNNDLPQWNLSINPARVMSLRKAADAHELFPLAQLITMHAGEVVGESAIKVEAFYGQNWAFARFLWEADDGKYRPALRHILADAAAGTIYDPTGSHSRPYLGWNPAGVKPMLERYLGMDLQQIQAAYDRFVQKIAYTDYQAQFQS